MKMGEINLEYLKNYMLVENDEDDLIVSLILDGAKAYIKNITGQTDSYLNSKDEITIALLSLCTDMYENREYTVKKSDTNKIVDTILNMHRINNLG